MHQDFHDHLVSSVYYIIVRLLPIFYDRNSLWDRSVSDSLFCIITSPSDQGEDYAVLTAAITLNDAFITVTTRFVNIFQFLLLIDESIEEDCATHGTR